MNPPAALPGPLYRKAVRWIAEADPLVRVDPPAFALSHAITVRLVAHLWDRPALLVARDVLGVRGVPDAPS